jgi:flagellar transcriptional activator FlhD
MNSNQLLNEIQETNLTYVMLAQQMLREDPDTAMYRLGVSKPVADILVNLSPAQTARMAASSTLLCRFRCDDRVILEMLTGYTKDKLMGPAHAAILMAGQPAASFA